MNNLSLFDLTDPELSASVYYGAAGIDIQPLLRFGDLATDFIYVNAGLNCEDFLGGVRHCVRQLSLEHPGLLRLIDVLKVLPPPGPFLIPFPDFMHAGQRDMYIQSFGAYSQDAGTCSLLLTFELRIGSNCRNLRLWHLNGEAIATYDRLFLRRKLAPKVLITIQSGLLERPSYIMDAMLSSSRIRPKVWVRGIWSNSAVEWYHTMPDVFDPIGIYDLKIWEARGWNADFGYSIPGTTDPNKPYRHVAGYGESSVWNELAPYGAESLIQGPSITIRKKNVPHDANRHRHYTRFMIPLLDAHLKTFDHDRSYYMLDRLKKSEYDPAVAFGIKGAYDAYSRAWGHFESHEMYASEFAETFSATDGVHFSIDLFYKWPLEYERNF